MRSGFREGTRAVSLKPTPTTKKLTEEKSPIWHRSGGPSRSRRRVLSQRQQRMMLRCIEEYARCPPSNPEQQQMKERMFETMKQQYEVSPPYSTHSVSPSSRCVCNNQPQLCALIHLRHWQEMIEDDVELLERRLITLQVQEEMFRGALEERNQQDPLLRLRQLKRQHYQLSVLLQSLGSNSESVK